MARGEVYFFNQQYSDSIKVYEQLKLLDKDQNTQPKDEVINIVMDGGGLEEKR